jgi:hypothetical protein
MNNLPQSSSVYYGRVFAEAFTQAAGEESFRNALTYIDPVIEAVVRQAGVEAGLILRGIKCVKYPGGFNA